jgi:hypothetical protein
VCEQVSSRHLRQTTQTQSFNTDESGAMLRLIRSVPDQALTLLLFLGRQVTLGRLAGWMGLGAINLDPFVAEVAAQSRNFSIRWQGIGTRFFHDCSADCDPAVALQTRYAVLCAGGGL